MAPKLAPRKTTFPSCLFDAILEGNHSKLKKLLNDPQAKLDAIAEDDGITLLGCAIEEGQMDCLDVLLKAGANPNQHFLHKGKDQVVLVRAMQVLFNERKALKAKAEVKIKTAIKWLLEGRGQKPIKANPNELIEAGRSVLDIAAYLGQYDFCEMLIQNGADVNLVHPTGTTLMVVLKKLCSVTDPDAQAVYLKIFDLLLAHGAAKTINHVHAGSTALIFAAETNIPSLCQKLLAAGAAVDVPTQEYSALGVAVELNHPEVVELLLAHNANRDFQYAQKPSPIDLTVEYAESEPHLLQAVFDPTNPQHSKKIADALEQDNPAPLAALIGKAYQFPLDQILQSAQFYNRQKVVAYIQSLQVGIVVNDQDRIEKMAMAFLLHTRQRLLAAINNDDIATCDKTTQLLTDLNYCDQEEGIPLMVAIWKKSPQIVKMLLDNGARTDFTDDEYYDSYPPIHLLIEFAQKKIAKIKMTASDKRAVAEQVAKIDEEVCVIAALLIQHGAMLEGTDRHKQALSLLTSKLITDPQTDLFIPGTHPKGVSILSAAAANGLYKTCELLLNSGVDPNFSLGGDTPLCAAINAKHPVLCHLLLERGASVDPIKKPAGLEQFFDEDQVSSPLEEAFLVENYDLCRDLLQRGADCNVLHDGSSLLNDAIDLKISQMVDMFLQYGAKPNIPGQHSSPLCSAVKQRDESLCRRLLDFGADVSYSETVEEGFDPQDYTPFGLALNQPKPNFRIMALVCDPKNPRDMAVMEKIVNSDDTIRLMMKMRGITFAEKAVTVAPAEKKLTKKPAVIQLLSKQYQAALLKQQQEAFLKKAEAEKMAAEKLEQERVKQAETARLQAIEQKKLSRKQEILKAVQEERRLRKAQEESAAKQAEEVRVAARRAAKAEEKLQAEVAAVVNDLCDDVVAIADVVDEITVQVEEVATAMEQLLKQVEAQVIEDAKPTIEIINPLNHEKITISKQPLLSLINNDLVSVKSKSFVLDKQELMVRDLHMAALKGDAETVKTLVTAQNVNLRLKPNGLTLLHRAVERNDIAMCQSLLKMGADINATATDENLTPLQVALNKGYQGLAVILLTEGAEHPDSPKTVKQPLDLVAVASISDVANVEKILALRREQNIVAQGDMVTAFVKAGELIKTNAVAHIRKLLVENGMFNLRDRYGNTLLHSAVLKNDMSTVANCLYFGANINDRNSLGHTALMLAAGRNNVLMCDNLVTFNASHDCLKFSDYFDALEMASNNNSHEAFQFILDKLFRMDWGLFALLEKAHTSNSVKLYEALLATKPINIADRFGHTLLFYAAVRGNTKICEDLIRRGANLNAENYEEKLAELAHKAAAVSNVNGEIKYRELINLFNNARLAQLRAPQVNTATHPATMFGRSAQRLQRPASNVVILRRPSL